MAAILSPVSHALTSLTHALPPRGRVVVTLVHVVLDRAVRRASSDVAPVRVRLRHGLPRENRYDKDRVPVFWNRQTVSANTNNAGDHGVHAAGARALSRSVT